MIELLRSFWSEILSFGLPLKLMPGNIGSSLPPLPYRLAILMIDPCFLEGLTDLNGFTC